MRNAKQSIRRTVAGLLAGAMLLGMTPLAAFAEGSSSASGDWQFKAFGTSTAAGVNTIADGADINGKVTLNSCTIKDDGTIDKKGGKFVADSPADGLSFYYTTIDPTTQNFYLQADVTIDYVNPAPDGQEGFALMVRDSISGSGSYFSNQISVVGTKLPLDGVEIKDAVGVRSYTGIISNETAASNDVKSNRAAFSSQAIKLDRRRRRLFDLVHLGEGQHRFQRLQVRRAGRPHDRAGSQQSLSGLCGGARHERDLLQHHLHHEHVERFRVDAPAYQLCCPRLPDHQPCHLHR